MHNPQANMKIGLDCNGYPIPSFGLSLGCDLGWPISIYIYCLNAVANEVTVYFEQQVQTPISSFSLNMQGEGAGVKLTAGRDTCEYLEQ